MKSLQFLLLAFACVYNPPESVASIVGGTLAESSTWRASDSPIFVDSDIVITNGIKLTIEPGTTIQLNAGISIRAQSGGGVDVQGTALSPVRFLSQVPAKNWGTLSASGRNSTLTLRHAEVASGGLLFGTEAVGLIEDCYIHDVPSAIIGNSAQMVTIRRSHVSNYSEVVFNAGTIILAEDSLFEHMTVPNSDALEIQAGPSGSIIRRCTFRHSTGSNSDAIDFNGTSGVLVQDCLIYDFTDKGVSMGAAFEGSEPDRGIVITNCSISQVNTGVAVKDGSTCALYQTTIADSTTALHLYQKFTVPADGGHITNGWNNIFWGNGVTVDASANSSIDLTYSTFEGTNWPGMGNSIESPLFINTANRDYRLAQDSSARFSGLNGLPKGALFPVGAPMALSHPRIEEITLQPGQTIFHFWADPERSYSILSGSGFSRNSWNKIAEIPSEALPRRTTVTNSITGTEGYFELTSP